MAKLKLEPFDGGLPSEIWHCVLDILYDNDHSSLKAVALCSSGMYKIAAPRLFKTLYIDCEDRRILPAHLCVYVKNIIVLRPCKPFWGFWGISPDFLKCLYHLFKEAENLQNFHWWHQIYMPGEVLYQLYRYCPGARVHIASSKIALCESMNSLKEKPLSAPQLSCVRSIESEWFAGEYDSSRKPHSKARYPAQLKDILSRCYNLKSLTLAQTGTFRPRPAYVSPELSMKEDEAKSSTRGIITLEEGDILPLAQLKNLRFHGMRFGPVQSKLWAAQLQLSKNIKHISLIGVDWRDLLPKITSQGCFPSLEALEMSIPNLGSSSSEGNSLFLDLMTQLYAFLRHLPPLKMFIGYGFSQDILEVLAKYHSKSLNHLRFRCQLSSNTNTGTNSSNQISSRTSIHRIDYCLKQFPHLESLGINVFWDTDEGLPHDILATVVLQSRIRHLELSLAEDITGGRFESWPYVKLNEATCQALVESLDNISPVINLRSIHIAIGHWFPFIVKPIPGWYYEGYLIGERDSGGCMHFRKVRQFCQRGGPMREGNFVPRVPSHAVKGDSPNDLRQDMESRIWDVFCGKLVRNGYLRY